MLAERGELVDTRQDRTRPCHLRCPVPPCPRPPVPRRFYVPRAPSETSGSRALTLVSVGGDEAAVCWWKLGVCGHLPLSVPHLHRAPRPIVPPLIRSVPSPVPPCSALCTPWPVPVLPFQYSWVPEPLCHPRDGESRAGASVPPKGDGAAV